VTEIAGRAIIVAAVGVVSVAGVVFAATRSGGGSGPDAAAADRWLPLASSPLMRTEVTAARIGRRIYVIGGFDESTGQTTSAVARYDIARDAWTRVSPLPIAVNHATATSYRGKVYVHGGFTDLGGLDDATARLYSYNPDRDRWKRLADSEVPRAAHALGEIDGRLLAAGGANSSSDRLTSLEIYNVSKRRWSSGPALSVGRNHVAGAVREDRFYVLGGRPGNLDVVEVYEPKRRRWSEAAPLNTPRSGFAAVVVRGRIVAFGGEESGGTIAPVELYHPDADRWTALPEMRTPRHGLGGAARKGRVFALEGGPQPGFAFSNAVEFLDVPRNPAR
jgi:serine/threonine-protein kinase PknK